jgi:hypothetical protein
MASICPHCHSKDVRAKNLARRVGGTVGALAGAASGVSGILGAARLGLVIGAPAGPVAAVLTAIASATLRGIVGATIGCEVGTVLGGLIDKYVLENDACSNCGSSVKRGAMDSSDFRDFSPVEPLQFPFGAHASHHDIDPDDEGDGDTAGLPALI